MRRRQRGEQHLRLSDGSSSLRRSSQHHLCRGAKRSRGYVAGGTTVQGDPLNLPQLRNCRCPAGTTVQGTRPNFTCVPLAVTCTGGTVTNNACVCFAGQVRQAGAGFHLHPFSGAHHMRGRSDTKQRLHLPVGHHAARPAPLSPASRRW